MVESELNAPTLVIVPTENIVYTQKEYLNDYKRGT